MSENPYAAPQTVVNDPLYASVGDVLLSTPRRCEVGRGVQWIGDAFTIFRAAPLVWIITFVVTMVAMVGAQLIPFLGPILTALIGPLIFALYPLLADGHRRDGQVDPARALNELQPAIPTLLLFGLAMLVVTLIIGALVFIPILGLGFFGAMYGAGTPEIGADFGLLFLLAMLIYFALALPVVMCYWFGPTLIVLHRKPLVEAIQMSFVGCLRNILPFLLYGIIGMVAAVVATLPIFLGWLVLGPLIYISVYTSYREIFLGAPTP